MHNLQSQIQKNCVFGSFQQLPGSLSLNNCQRNSQQMNSQKSNNISKRARKCQNLQRQNFLFVQQFNYSFNHLLYTLSLISLFYKNLLLLSLHLMSQAIKVVVRVRPMNTKQKQLGCKTIVQCHQQNHQIKLLNSNEQNNSKIFAYDNVFTEQSTQQLVYSKTAYGLVENVLLGYNGTIFAYGQTGCGKTHSMVGKVESEELQGIIPRSFGHILSSISNATDKQFLIRCSFVEIYNEEVRDLLSDDVKAKLEVKQSPEKGVFIKDLSLNTAKTHGELMGYMNIGNKNRSTGQTAMNKDSSRSHLIFMLYLESAELSDKEDKKYIASKLNLVDLAGSERLSKTGAQGDRLKEAQKINLSLSALGNVISALVDGKSHHIPYRDSKLTRLLQDSLGGNTKTVMIANCSPADYNYDQTLSTLRYASRAKFIKNKPIINQDPKDALLKQYAQEIKKLKMMISQQNGEIPPQQIVQIQNPNSNQMDEKLKQKELQLFNQKQEKRKLQQKIKDLERIHVVASQIHVDKNIKRAIERASILNRQDELHLSQKKQSDGEQSIEQQEKKLQKNENLVNTQQINLKYKSLVKKLKDKVKGLQNQLKDLNHEHYIDKQAILEDIRGLNKENQLLEGIIGMLLKPSQIQTVKEASSYNEQKQQFRIPPFYLKNKQLTLPKLNENQSLQMIKQMKQGRRMSWTNQKDEQENNLPMKSPFKNNQNLLNVAQSPYSNDKMLYKQNMGGNVGSSVSIGYGQQDKQKFTISDIIKDARKDTNKVGALNGIGNGLMGGGTMEKKNLTRKVQLQPIKKEEGD